MNSVSSEPSEKKSTLGVVVHSFFIVPFLIAVFCILVFVSVRILTMEKHTAVDYLEDIRDGGRTKRWQAAYELSKLLSTEKGGKSQNPEFVQGITKLLENSVHDDIRVQQYLSLAMGRTGNPVFVETLLKSLANAREEVVPSLIHALGLLRDKKAQKALEEKATNQNTKIRLAAVIALGHIGQKNSIPVLKGRLEDGEPNIRWDASIALAKMGDSSGKDILARLLDRTYLSGVKGVDTREQTQVMLVAIRAAALLNDSQLNNSIRKLSVEDKNIKVKKAALEVLG